jgi:hypothetical protein
MVAFFITPSILCAVTVIYYASMSVATPIIHYIALLQKDNYLLKKFKGDRKRYLIFTRGFPLSSILHSLVYTHVLIWSHFPSTYTTVFRIVQPGLLLEYSGRLQDLSIHKGWKSNLLPVCGF